MPGYLTKQERVAVRGVDDLHIRSLLDHQQYHDPHGQAAAQGLSAATWPLFGLLWPSGAELAAHLGQHPVTPGERILELGCGLGLASLVGHRRGADVTASDCHPLAGEFLAHNARLNGLPPLPYAHGRWGQPVAPTAPPHPRAQQPSAGHGPNCLHGPNNLNDPNGPSGPAADGHLAAGVHGRFHLIMGSDVLYERDDDGGLAGFIERHATDDAQVWIVDPHRGNRPAFNRRMQHLGFALHEQRLDRSAQAPQAAYRGRLLTYRRPCNPTAPPAAPAPHQALHRTPNVTPDTNSGATLSITP